MQVFFPVLVVHMIWALQCVLRINASEGCSGRVVLNTTTGYISDGVGNYPAPSHCEWLIDGKSVYISLFNEALKENVACPTILAKSYVQTTSNGVGLLLTNNVVHIICSNTIK